MAHEDGTVPLPFAVRLDQHHDVQKAEYCHRHQAEQNQVDVGRVPAGFVCPLRFLLRAFIAAHAFGADHLLGRVHGQVQPVGPGAHAGLLAQCRSVNARVVHAHLLLGRDAVAWQVPVLGLVR
ncbi:hypothetical protein D3C71_1256550 [compost metagenome]